MGAGMADAFQLGHFRAVIQGFALRGLGGRLRRLSWLLVLVRHKKRHLGPTKQKRPGP
jgi:hypothetical protein